MPEAAVYIHGDVRPSEQDVGGPPQVLLGPGRDPEAVSIPMELGPNR